MFTTSLAQLDAFRSASWQAASLLGFAALATLTAVILTLTLRTYRLVRHYQKQGIPGTPFRPLIGDLHLIARARSLRTPLHVSRDAGGRPLFSVSGPEPFADIFKHLPGKDGYHCLGPEMRLRIMSPERVRGVLVTHNNAFEKPELMKRLLAPALGRGLLTADGEHWRVHRRMIGPSFHYDALVGMASLMVTSACDAVERNFLTLASGVGVDSVPVVDVHERISGLTLDIIGKAAFGLSLGEDQETSSRMYRDVSDLLQSVVASVFNFSAFLPGFALYAEWRDHERIAAIRNLLRRAITLRRASRARDSAPAGRKEMLLDILLDARDDEADATGGRATLSDEEVMDEAITFILAGHETTAQALTWAMFLLALHPEWKDRARAALRDVVPGATALTHDHVHQVPMLTWIVHETLRLYPPAPMVARCAVRDVDLAGLHVMAGTNVVVPVAAIHRDPELWDDPEMFKPERWTGGVAAAAKHPLAFLPFSAGPRNCVGSQFAMMEARLVLAVLLLSTDWQLDTSYVHQPLAAITLRPAHGMPMRVWKINSA